MSTRESIEKIVNIVIALGFIAVALGAGLWFLDLADRLRLSYQATMVIGGIMVLVFGLLAARLISKLESL